MNLFKRQRYSVWQVSNKSNTLIASGRTLKEAKHDAAYLNQTLAQWKALAPSGPQEMRAIVMPDGLPL